MAYAHACITRQPSRHLPVRSTDGLGWLPILTCRHAPSAFRGKLPNLRQMRKLLLSRAAPAYSDGLAKQRLSLSLQVEPKEIP